VSPLSTKVLGVDIDPINPEALFMRLAHRNLLLVLLISFTAIFDVSHVNAQIPSQDIVIFDLTGFEVPDFTFFTFNNGVPTNDGFAVSVGPAEDNFGGIGDTDSLIVRDFLLTEDTEFLVEAIIGDNNDSDFTLAIREASGEFFSIPVSGTDLADDGQAIVGISDFAFNGDVDDGIPNSVIIEVGLQSTFGSGNAVDVVLQRVSILPPVFVLGDCDLDGDVDFADIPAFIDVLVAGSFLDEADCNQDGVVNFPDIPVFIAILAAS